MNYIQRIYDLLTEAQINEVGNPALKAKKTGLPSTMQSHAKTLQQSAGQNVAQKWLHKAASKAGVSMIPINPSPAMKTKKPGSYQQNPQGRPSRR